MLIYSLPIVKSNLDVFFWSYLLLVMGEEKTVAKLSDKNPNYKDFHYQSSVLNLLKEKFFSWTSPKFLMLKEEKEFPLEILSQTSEESW